LPVTSKQVRLSAAPVIGLAPTSPVITEDGTSVTPDLVRTAKEDADFKFTGAGPFPFGFMGWVEGELPQATVVTSSITISTLFI
jgi:hypothetical protein